MPKFDIIKVCLDYLTKQKKIRFVNLKGRNGPKDQTGLMQKEEYRIGVYSWAKTATGIKGNPSLEELVKDSVKMTSRLRNGAAQREPEKEIPGTAHRASLLIATFVVYNL